MRTGADSPGIRACSAFARELHAPSRVEEPSSRLRLLENRHAGAHTFVVRNDKRKSPAIESGSEAPAVLERNVQAILANREQFEQDRGFQDRIADAITRFSGSMSFVYLHIVVYGRWILLDSGRLPLPPLDPTFVSIALAASIEALFLATFVLISQNRMATLEDRRADLNLQISLLAEHEVTRLLALVTEIAKKMNIAASSDPELSELSEDVGPEKVLDTLEHKEREHVETRH